MTASMPPVEVNASSSSPYPSWNTSTRTPNDAPSESTLSSRALAGMSSEPVMRKSRTNVAATTTPTASGASATSESVKSSREAAWPVTQVSAPTSSARSRWVTASASGEEASATTRSTSTTVIPSRSCGGRTRVTPSRSPARATRSATTSGSVEPSTTVTSAADRAGKSASRVSNSTRWALSAGSSSTPDVRSVMSSAGTPSSASSAATPTATSHGRRWVHRASTEKNPVAGGTSPKAAVIRRRPGTRRSRPGRSSRPPPTASNAGTRVSATSSATTTTLSPAAPTARRIEAWNRSSPDRLSATVMPENVTVRPAVAIVRRSASTRCSRSLCRWRRPSVGTSAGRSAAGRRASSR